MRLGQERFKTITTSYYRGAHGLIIVYDITSMESFNSIKKWLVDVERFASPTVLKLIVGNKSDLAARRAVDYKIAKVFPLRDLLVLINSYRNLRMIWVYRLLRLVPKIL